MAIKASSLLISLTAALALTTLLGGCETTEGSKECAAVEACGGDLVGTWTVSDSCVGGLAAAANMAGLPAACGDIVSDTEVQLSGTFSFGATVVTSSVTFATDMTLDYHPACLAALGATTVDANICTSIGDEAAAAAAIASATCSFQNNGCVCAVTTASTTSPVLDGAYQISSNNIAIAGQNVPYCVDGDTLTITGTTAGGDDSITLTRLQ